MLLAVRTAATAMPRILGACLLLSATTITTASTKARRFTACKAQDPSNQYLVVRMDSLVPQTQAATITPQIPMRTTANPTQAFMVLMVNQFAC